MSVGIFHEANGDWSYARVSGAACMGAIILGFLVALVTQKWDAALILAGYLSGYSVLAYGANRMTAAKEAG